MIWKRAFTLAAVAAVLLLGVLALFGLDQLDQGFQLASSTLVPPILATLFISAISLLVAFPIVIAASISELVAAARASDSPLSPRDRLLRFVRVGAGPLLGVFAGVLFGVVTRAQFGSGFNALGPLSLSFFIYAPIAIGFITVLLAPPSRRGSWSYALLAPWVPCVICIIIAALFFGEAAFCICLAIPLL